MYAKGSGFTKARFWLFCTAFLYTQTAADILECFSCQNAQSQSDCHSTINCAKDEVCYTESVVSNGSSVYNLGCRNISNCHKSEMDHNSGRSIMARAQSEDCDQCCTASYCNKKLCPLSTVINMSSCHDDPHFDCAMVASTFDICSDVNHAKSVCKKHCGLCNLVDGSWAEWNAWSTCDQHCGQGLKLRMRTCTNPPPAIGGDDCVGDLMETTNCTLGPCSVDGGWSAWAAWSFCDRTCDLGQKLRLRQCNSPAPANGGKDCPGDSMEVSTCTVKACPTDGDWSAWGQWSNCDRTCGQSEKIRIRSCTSPAPANGGKDCQGQQMDIADCNVPLHCPIDGRWSHWSTFDACSTTCGAGLHKRFRNCSNPIPQYNGKPCFGPSVDYEVCVQKACADGGWSQWSDWTNCSVSCDGGLMSRTRSCDNPHTSTYGTPCQGKGVEYVTCNKQNCPVKTTFFTVNTPTHPAHWSPDQLIFTNVVTNEGNGYNASRGEFVCHIPGVYHIELSVSGNGKTHCGITHNTTEVIVLNTIPGTTTASSAYVRLHVGDYLRVLCAGGMNFIDAQGANVFSGALVLKL